MANIKHVGRIRTNKRRCIVAYRTLPGDPYNALVVMTESLPADEHDTLIKLVESAAGQQAEELALAMSRAYLPDGRNMLAGFHATGQLKKVATTDIEMIPNANASIPLDKLNEIIAQQRGVALEDLAVKPTTSTVKETVEPVKAEVVNDTVTQAMEVATQPEVLTDDVLAAQLRSQADSLFKEAKRLREQAEELAPTKKTTTKKAESAKA
jgi:hypothetical protein